MKMQRKATTQLLFVKSVSLAKLFITCKGEKNIFMWVPIFKIAYLPINWLHFYGQRLLLIMGTPEFSTFKYDG